MTGFFLGLATILTSYPASGEPAVQFNNAPPADVTSEVTDTFTDVCLRTKAVREAIELASQKPCSQINAAGPKLKLDNKYHFK